MRHWRLILVVLLITAYTDTLVAKMYKWVDQNGKVTYSNVAPPSSAQQVKTTTETGEPPNQSSIASVSGIYRSQKHKNRSIILDINGSFFLDEDEKGQHRGTYKLNGRKIILSLSDGKTVSGTIEGDILIDSHGRRWKKDLSNKQGIGTSVISSSSTQQGETTKKEGPDDPILNPALVASGIIKDQSGQTLSEVKVRIRESYLTTDHGEYNRDRSLIVHDGNFTIACKECSAMSFRFTKEGYYSTNADATIFEDYLSRLSEAELIAVSQRGTPPQMPTVKKENMEVVLEQVQHKQPTNLINSGAVLSSGPDWNDMVAVLKGKILTAIPLSVIQAKSGSTENPLYIQLEPTLDNSGQLVAVPAKPRPVPAPAILDFSHADGGIIVYQPSTSVVNMALREMKTAPENGYASRIKVPHLGGGEIYFYCLINGIYGKGYITGVRFEHASRKRKRIGLGISLYLNPDGSRNLEDVRY